MGINFDTNWLPSVTRYKAGERAKSPGEAGKALGSLQKGVADPEKDGARGRSAADYLAQGIYDLFHSEKKESGSMQKLGAAASETVAGKKAPIPGGPGQIVNHVEGEGK